MICFTAFQCADIPAEKLVHANASYDGHSVNDKAVKTCNPGYESTNPSVQNITLICRLYDDPSTSTRMARWESTAAQNLTCG